MNGIVQYAEAGGFTAQAMTAAARSASIHLDQSVAVTLYVTKGYADAISAYLSDNGASPRNIGADYIEAYIPVSLLPSAAEQPGVISVRTIISPLPAQGTVVSQGAAAHGVPAWHAADIRGQGVRIGIIDTGFEGFSSLMGTELPMAVQARCYTDVGVFSSSLAECTDSEDAETTRNHGTAVTEIAFDIAPEATYYISNPLSLGDLQATVRWMVEQDVDVINMSMLFLWEGPGDGTTPYTNGTLRSVDIAISGGITFVNSAGNESDATWYGKFADLDSDRWHNFSSDESSECVFIGNGFESGESYLAQLRWDDNWLAPATDLDLYLAMLGPDGLIDVAASENVNSETGEPFEWIEFTASVSGEYCLSVNIHSGGVPEWIQLQSFSAQDLAHHTKSGSIGSPAEERESRNARSGRDPLLGHTHHRGLQ